MASTALAIDYIPPYLSGSVKSNGHSLYSCRFTFWTRRGKASPTDFQSYSEELRLAVLAAAKLQGHLALH
ncbi:hypothetical protein J6590_104637, partial [Homalodisca vitripennis]